MTKNCFFYSSAGNTDRIQPRLNRVFWFWIYVFLVTAQASAQWVKDDDTTKIWLTDGIYLNESDLLNNSPALKWADVDLMNWRTRDSLERKRILIYPNYQPHLKYNLRINDIWVYGIQNSVPRVIPIDSVWGICIHGEPFRYLQRARGENFIRIPIKGTISFFQYTVYFEDPFYWTPDIMRMEPEFHTERIDLVLDFEKKEIYKNTRQNLENIIQRDSSLWNSYLKEKKKMRVIDNYVEQYNSNNPIEFYISADSSHHLGRGKP